MTCAFAFLQSYQGDDASVQSRVTRRFPFSSRNTRRAVRPAGLVPAERRIGHYAEAGDPIVPCVLLLSLSIVRGNLLVPNPNPQIGPRTDLDPNNVPMYIQERMYSFRTHQRRCTKRATPIASGRATMIPEIKNFVDQLNGIRFPAGDHHPDTSTLAEQRVVDQHNRPKSNRPFFLMQRPTGADQHQPSGSSNWLRPCRPSGSSHRLAAPPLRLRNAPTTYYSTLRRQQFTKGTSTQRLPSCNENLKTQHTSKALHRVHILNFAVLLGRPSLGLARPLAV